MYFKSLQSETKTLQRSKQAVSRKRTYNVTNRESTERNGDRESILFVALGKHRAELLNALVDIHSPPALNYTQL